MKELVDGGDSLGWVRVDLSQHVQSFVVLVELVGNCEIATVD
jgi:hypothetical protein